jgi:hypothetical protein
MAAVSADHIRPVISRAFDLNASSYIPHDLHRTERIWPETNCYVDLWIELLHALRLDPIACMAFTIAMDFEGDQWTFFKPSATDIHELFGIDIQELAIWRPLEIHLAEQVRRGRVPLVEVDAFHLPDTVGVSYQTEHTKTTIGVQAIDLEARTLGYFHSSGYFELGKAEFNAMFDTDATAMAPYTEIAKLDRIVRPRPSELGRIAAKQLQHYVMRIPGENPVTKYRERYLSDVTWLALQNMSVFYKYAFATLRQCGACAELAATFLDWLPSAESDRTAAAVHFADIAAAAKAMQFKIARMMATGKAADVAPLLDQMESSWDSAMGNLAASHAI